MLREGWFGATGRRVPGFALAGSVELEAALVLDSVDGRVARRTASTTAVGARFDMEVDAFLILVLSAYVVQSVGLWVLTIGAARYAFVAAGWLLPWFAAMALISWLCDPETHPELFGWVFLINIVVTVVIYFLAMRFRLSRERTDEHIRDAEDESAEEDTETAGSR